MFDEITMDRIVHGTAYEAQLSSLEKLRGLLESIPGAPRLHVGDGAAVIILASPRRGMPPGAQDVDEACTRMIHAIAGWRAKPDSADSLMALGDALDRLRTTTLYFELGRLAASGNLGSLLEEPATQQSSDLPIIVRNPLDGDILGIGKQFMDGRTTWLPGAKVDIGPQGVMVVIFTDDAHRLVEPVTRGRLSMRVLAKPYTLMFLVEFGDGSWVEAPFNAHKVEAVGRGPLSPPHPGEGWIGHVVVVESDGGLVRAIRGFALSHEFSATIHRLYNEQLALPPDEPCHVAEIAQMQRRPMAALAEEANHTFELDEPS